MDLVEFPRNIIEELEAIAKYSNEFMIGEFKINNRCHGKNQYKRKLQIFF